jgi:hypothetical protein
MFVPPDATSTSPDTSGLTCCSSAATRVTKAKAKAAKDGKKRMPA